MLRADAGIGGRMTDHTTTRGKEPDTALSPEHARLWAVMSHEIRTPLMGVVGMLEVLNRTGLSEEQRRILATAEESSATLMRIIDDVLDFAKLQSTQVRFETAAADPLAILEGAADLLSQLAAAKRLSLTCEMLGEVPAIMCDALRLRQVLLNLAANAVKYTDCGSVSLTVAQLARNGDTATLRFSVQDTGQGIPADLQGFLFQPFWQLAGSSGLGGVGLGLAICRTLVDAMGGRIAVDSAAGRGTRFDIDIPFTVAPTADTAVARPLEGCEIVVVDTGERALGIALRLLAAAGADITRVENLGLAPRRAAKAEGPMDKHAGKRPVILIGPEAEAEDVEATAYALQRVNPDLAAALIWLYPGPGGNLPGLRYAVAPVAAYPMRRRDLVAAVMTVSGAARGPSGLTVVARHDPQHPPADTTDAVNAARADGLVVLVAEDNRVNQEVLRQQLAILGYDCDVVPTGHAALKAMDARRYPLLLCDCHMPGMDGFELTGLIRAREGAEGTSHMPIVAVTANAVPGEAMRCRAAGMDDYLAKPIEIGALQAKLERWIGSPQARTALTGASWTGPAPDAAMPVVDLSALIEVYGRDRARLGPVLARWCATVTEALGDLEASLGARAWETAGAISHRLKGSAGVAGAASLSAAVAVLEVVLKGGNAAAIADESARLRVAAQRALADVEEWLAATAGQAALWERPAGDKSDVVSGVKR